MIKIEKTEVMGWEAAIRGMRNPKNSWDKSDTDWFRAANEEDVKEALGYDGDTDMYYLLGHNDLELMNKLAYGGPVHAKYRRMITVYVDITAPLYWWKEFDTYKVGTVANSCSTMHKIHEKEFTLEDFSIERMNPGDARLLMEKIVEALNCARTFYNLHHDPEFVDHLIKDDGRTLESINRSRKGLFDTMIQLLPSSYNQKRTVMLNYEVLVGIYKWRKNHKLDEWVEFCKWIETLPYSEIITAGLFKEEK